MANVSPDVWFVLSLVVFLASLASRVFQVANGPLMTFPSRLSPMKLAENIMESAGVGRAPSRVESQYGSETVGSSSRSSNSTLNLQEKANEHFEVFPMPGEEGGPRVSAAAGAGLRVIDGAAVVHAVLL